MTLHAVCGIYVMFLFAAMIGGSVFFAWEFVRAVIEDRREMREWERQDSERGL